MPRARTVLLILDMISDFEFPDGEAVLRAARRIAPRIAALKARAAKARVPTIYVNDNLGRWRSDVRALLARCSSENARGCEVVQQIAPGEKDFFLLKPKHSGFYATPLAELLAAAGAKRLILTGLSTHQCILFTANDAYVRDYKLFVPADCTASNSIEENEHALAQMENVLKADINIAAELDLKAINS